MYYYHIRISHHAIYQHHTSYNITSCHIRTYNLLYQVEGEER